MCSSDLRGWKVFVSNRVKKIAETAGPVNITLKYCPSELNLADVGSRGPTIVRIEKGTGLPVRIGS